MLKWILNEGGVEEMNKRNLRKSKKIYDFLDGTNFYQSYANQEDRSMCNVTFNLNNPKNLQLFLEDSLKEGLFSLKGHKDLGGVRASMYNSMPIEGVNNLIDFMKYFERKMG